MQFGPFIDEHDLGIKLSRAREFIGEGDKVRFVVKFKGRQMAKQNLGRELLNKASTQMEDIAKVEQPVKMEGRQMIMVMSKGMKKDESAEVAEVKQETQPTSN